MMERNNSYGTSWADQWDNSYAAPTVYDGSKKSGGATAKYREKMEMGFGKTKAVASNGVRKVKTGTSHGLQWIKDKYHKTTQRH